LSDHKTVSLTVSGLSRLWPDLSGLVEFARIAEANGIDQILMTDHVVMGPHTERYPYGPFPMAADEPWPEPLTVLAAIAGATESIRLGTGVLIAPVRSAPLLAKTAATLDALSGGRLDLGVGTGWQREEYEAVGIPFEGRYGRMMDVLRGCRELWKGEPCTFRSKTVSFEEVSCLPRPAQEGGPPLWFGLALTERNVPRIVELGAGWMPIDSDPAGIAKGVATLEQAFAAAGRDFSRFGVRAHAPIGLRDGRPDLEATLDGANASREAGVDVVAFALAAFVYDPSGLATFVERIARWADA